MIRESAEPVKQHVWYLHLVTKTMAIKCDHSMHHKNFTVPEVLTKTLESMYLNSDNSSSLTWPFFFLESFRLLSRSLLSTLVALPGP